MIAQKTNLCFDLMTKSVVFKNEHYRLKLFLKKKKIYFLNVFLSQQNSKKKTFGVEP